MEEDRITGEQAIEMSSITSIHPELSDLIRNPGEFSTEIKRFSQPIIPNPIISRTGSYPENRRKFVTADVGVHEKLGKLGHDVPSFLGAGGPREMLALDPHKVNVGIVVAGGTAPGTNAVIHWITKRHVADYGMTTGKILGFLGGFRGLGQKGTNNVRLLRLEDTQKWLPKGGCEIGMSRYFENIGTMVNTLEELCIDILYMIGGDGTLEAAHHMCMEIERRGLKIIIATVPKTIDNDIVWSWKTFGFDTAVNEATRCINNFHENIRTHGRVGTIFFYGGESGFLAANAALSSGVADAVLIPEEKVDMQKLLSYIGRCVSRQSPCMEDHALIVVAEGIALKEPFRTMFIQELKDRGKIDNIKDFELPITGINEDIRSAFTGAYYKQFFEKFGQTMHSPVIIEPRSLVNSMPPSDIDIRFCQRLAYNAVDNALAGFTDFMSSYWMTEYVLVPLGMVAGKQKLIPVDGWFWKNLKATTGQPQF